ncbi:YpiF family protein [Virgibacillus ainsalahensis]
MKWSKTDIPNYMEAKEYIDTLLMPLIPFQFSNDSELDKNTFQNELLSVLSNEIEKELTGRIMLTPNYYYLKSSNKENEIDRINSWVEDVKNQPFTNIFFVTFDAAWKKEEQALEGTVLWLPANQSGDLYSKEMHQLVRGQVEQISELIRAYW